MFKEYHNMKRELSLMEFQLGRFKGISGEELIGSMCFSRPEGERVQTSRVSDKTAMTAIHFRQAADRMNDEWFDFIFQRYEEMREELEFFEYGIKSLTGNLPEVIWDMVVDGSGWEEMMEKYHVSHSMIAKYRKKAIKELDKGYELRDRQTEAYILS